MSVFFKYARDMRAYLKWYLKWYLNVIFVSVFVIQIYRFGSICKRWRNWRRLTTDKGRTWKTIVLWVIHRLISIQIGSDGNEIKEAGNFGTWNDVSDYWYKIERMYFIYGGLPYTQIYLLFQIAGRWACFLNITFSKNHFKYHLKKCYSKCYLENTDTLL